MMRREVSRLVPALLILLTPALGAAAADADRPDRERIHQSYELARGASVEVLGIAGPVEIETTTNDAAEVNVIRSAPTHADLECGKIEIEQTQHVSGSAASRTVPSFEVSKASRSNCRARWISAAKHRRRRPHRRDRAWCGSKASPGMSPSPSCARLR